MAQGDAPAAVPVWLDLEREQLRRGDKTLYLRPKSFAVLRYLVAHPGRVLSMDELVEAVWSRTAISDGVLTVSIAEIRRALGDAAQALQYLDADSGRSRPRIRDDVARQSDLMSLGVPR